MSNLDEPMLPANEAMREIEEQFDPVEAMIAWDVPHIAAEPEAVKAVLKEYIVRLMFEHGGAFRANTILADLVSDAWTAAGKEFVNSKIIKEGQVDV